MTACSLLIPKVCPIILQLLLSEKDLIVREEACRIGLLFGGFTGAFHAMRCLLRRTRNKETPMNG